MTIKEEGLTYKGTKIIIGDEARQKRYILNECTRILSKHNCDEIVFPLIQYKDNFASKVGEENRNMMFDVKDRSDRSLCLPPEYTALVQVLARTKFKNQKNVKLFYIGECFRGENPQYGRYRQFTQLGVEVINPLYDPTEYLILLAKELITWFYLPLEVEREKTVRESIRVENDATRGLDYYVSPTTGLPAGKGFEIHCDLLGNASQVCGGGSYEGGAGFALGVDRLLLLKQLVYDRSPSIS